MQVITQKDFAKLAGLENKQISVYLKRGKIIANKIIGKGKGRVVTFDVDHPTNKTFLESRMILLGNREPEHDEITGDLSDLLSSEDEFKDLQDQYVESEEFKNRTKRMSGYELDLELKRAELALRNQKEKIQDLVLAKAKRKLISSDVVSKAVAEVVQRFQASFLQQSDQLVRDLLNTFQADSETITEALSRLTDIANEVSERAVNEARIAIENSCSDSISLAK